MMSAQKLPRHADRYFESQVTPPDQPRMDCGVAPQDADLSGLTPHMVALVHWSRRKRRSLPWGFAHVFRPLSFALLMSMWIFDELRGWLRSAPAIPFAIVWACITLGAVVVLEFAFYLHALCADRIVR